MLHSVKNLYVVKLAKVVDIRRVSDKRVVKKEIIGFKIATFSFDTEKDLSSCGNFTLVNSNLTLPANNNILKKGCFYINEYAPLSAYFDKKFVSSKGVKKLENVLNGFAKDDNNLMSVDQLYVVNLQKTTNVMFGHNSKDIVVVSEAEGYKLARKVGTDYILVNNNNTVSVGFESVTRKGDLYIEGNCTPFSHFCNKDYVGFVEAIKFEEDLNKIEKIDMAIEAEKCL